MDKTKRKAKRRLMPRQSTSESVPFDFQTSLPLTECVERLDSHEKQGFWAKRQTLVEVNLLDNSTAAFHLSRKYPFMITMEVRGHVVQQWEDKPTRITGEIRVAKREYVSVLISVPIIVMFVFGEQSGSGSFPICGLFVLTPIALFWSLMQSWTVGAMDSEAAEVERWFRALLTY